MGWWRRAIVGAFSRMRCRYERFFWSLALSSKRERFAYAFILTSPSRISCKSCAN